MDENNAQLVRLFFVKTELERVVADMIAGSFNDDATCLLFAYKERLLGSYLWGGWSQKKYLALTDIKGLFSGQRVALSHLSEIESSIKIVGDEIKDIEIYLSRLKNNNSNYSIRYLQKRYGEFNVGVCIIPHGASSFYRGILTPKELKKIKSKNNILVRTLFPKLEYFEFSGERYGADTDVVKRIYTFPGHVLDHPKAEFIDISSFRRDSGAGAESNDALIVGQPVYMRQRLTPDQVEKINLRISQLLKERGCGKVYFLPHPREDGSMCFFQPGFELIKVAEPLELMLLNRAFKTVISSFSTGLFTSQIILGDHCQTYAVGMNLVNVDEDELTQLRSGFEGVGVNMIDI
ncbi:polysialyltransferase family glycosyltransferase [Oceanicoccus sp. KOV_DT_Chl]|uniref:polysialyltransferase family glycosyltransferase n=1 Tax=Oceanicoccus sp. KOV_DT_Chl TaxID=1904639 RepID=UPI000C79850D|nr:polysialyltransferase family glycosyltransferase [Oceanicoccus sp. KOV_DT_Chl]